ncbi:MAG: hypothetical protein L3K52_17720 [Candidatus Thiothrix sulfatifontis]|nr:MAG: hypothetical protein L3K52_17720 [Candidatus Thiothrix sulfatifontis]
MQILITGSAGFTGFFLANAVVNLGVQAGGRYSIDNPNAYVDSNVVAL